MVNASAVQQNNAVNVAAVQGNNPNSEENDEERHTENNSGSLEENNDADQDQNKIIATPIGETNTEMTDVIPQNISTIALTSSSTLIGESPNTSGSSEAVVCSFFGCMLNLIYLHFIFVKVSNCVFQNGVVLTEELSNTPVVSHEVVTLVCVFFPIFYSIFLVFVGFHVLEWCYTEVVFEAN